MNDRDLLSVSMPADMVEFIRATLGYTQVPTSEGLPYGFLVVIHKADLPDNEIEYFINRFQNEYYQSVCTVTAENTDQGFEIHVTWK